MQNPLVLTTESVNGFRTRTKKVTIPDSFHDLTAARTTDFRQLTCQSKAQRHAQEPLDLDQPYPSTMDKVIL